MKRLLIVMLGAMIALTSCQADAGLEGISYGEEVVMTLSASMSGDSATTRAAGDGETVDRCVLEVYAPDGSLYKRDVTTVTDLTATFSIRLVSSQEYEILLWADKGGEDYADALYNTNNEAGLKKITTSYEGYVGNDEERDAFYYYDTVLITASTAIEAKLSRPFGQVNVKTYLTDVPESMYPASVLVEYATEVGSSFDISTGAVDDYVALNWSAAAEVMDGATGTEESVEDKYIELSTDYLFAAADEQDLHNFKMTFYDDEDVEITDNENFKNIPVQRNYCTNISGELLTKQGTINVEITPDFTEPDNSVTIQDVATLADLDLAMEADDEKIEASYAVAAEVTSDITISIPALDGDAKTTNDTTSRSIELTSGIASDVEVTITSSGDDKDTTPDVVYITVPTVGDEETANTSNLIINLPYSTVYVNGSLYSVAVTTAEETFVINEGSEVTGLTINAGNVKVYGTLKGDVTLGDGNTAAKVTVYTATADVSAATFAEGITVIKYNVSHPIQNITSGNSYEATELEKAVEESIENDEIELAAGTYTLTQDSSYTGYYDVEGFYLLINTEGLTIRGIGEVIIDSEDFVGTGGTDYPKQNLVTVRANNVTFENLTFYANTNAAYTHDDVCYPNKTIELPSGKYFGLTVDGCTFLGADGSKTSGAGRFYLGAKTVASDTTIATIKNSKFYCGAVSVHTGVATIDNCTFNGILYNYEYSDTI